MMSCLDFCFYLPDPLRGHCISAALFELLSRKAVAPGRVLVVLLLLRVYRYVILEGFCSLAKEHMYPPWMLNLLRRS
jgi:hypothetical protein